MTIYLTYRYREHFSIRAGRRPTQHAPLSQSAARRPNTVVAHAPITSTPSARTVTDKPSARRATPAAEIAFLCAASAIFTLYAGFILGGIFYTEWERMLPPQANHVIMTSLAVVEVVAVMLLIDARRRARGDEQFTILAAQNADIRARLSRRRSTDETTVPIAGVTHRVVYQSASASVVHDPAPALSVGVVAAEVERRMADKIEEFGQREWWRGFNSCVQSGLDGVGADVLRLPGARGRTHR